jgi:hypothetical protein
MATPIVRAHPRVESRNPFMSRSFLRSRDINAHGRRYNSVQRAQCLILLMKGFSHYEIRQRTEIKESI